MTNETYTLILPSPAGDPVRDPLSLSASWKWYNAGAVGQVFG